MKQCSNCGAQLSEEATFCSECGVSTRFKGNQPGQQSQTGEQPYIDQQPYQRQYQHPYQQPQPMQYPPQGGGGRGMSQKTMIFILAGALLLAGLIIVILLVRNPQERVYTETVVTGDAVTPVTSSVTTQTAGDAPVQNPMYAAAPTVQKLHATVNDAMHIAPQGNNTYYARNMLDGKPYTAWTVDAYEADDGLGINLLRFNINARRLDYINLTNGYAKSAKRFHQNARAGYVHFSRVPIEVASDADIIFQGPVKDTMSPQTLKVSPSYDNSRPTNTVYVSFTDVIHGDTYYNDFCISEIEFYGIKE